jgi:hypothetical protein
MNRKDERSLRMFQSSTLMTKRAGKALWTRKGIQPTEPYYIYSLKRLVFLLP